MPLVQNNVLSCSDFGRVECILGTSGLGGQVSSKLAQVTGKFSKALCDVVN